MANVTLTRRQLYDLVWAEPLSTLCKRYQISDVGLRKICLRLAIPLPAIGYWNKVKAGKKVKQLPFAENDKVPKDVTLTLATNTDDAGKDGPSELALLQQVIEAYPNINLRVPETLTDPDPLVIRAKKALTKKDKYYREGDLLYAGLGELSISVTPALLNRALCFIDTFIKAMKQRGHSFRISDRESYVVLGQEEMEMNLAELKTRITIEERYTRTETHPNGRLALRFKRWSARIEIKDGKLPVEQQLSRLIAKLEILGEQFRLQEIERAKQRLASEERRRKQEAFEARRKSEIKAFKQALKDTECWQRALQFRAYIDHIEQKAMTEDRFSQELQVWVDWAKNKANWLDPLTESQDFWLEGIAPDALIASLTPILEPSYSGYYRPADPPVKAWPILPWYLKNN